MVEVIQKYKMVFIILSLVAFVIIAWFILTKESTGDMSSRGVFVLGQQISYTDVLKS
jgi:hypothetical protein